MDKLSATDVVLIIGAIGLVLTNTISAWRTSNKVDAAAVKADTAAIDREANHADTASKLDVIKESTDGNLTKIQTKLDALEVKAASSEKRADDLQSIIGSLTAGLKVSINKLPDTNGHK